MRGLSVILLLASAIIASCGDDGLGDDIPSGAKSLAIGRTANGSIDTGANDFVDWYRLELDDGGTINISVSFNAPSNVSGARVNIYNGAGLGVTATEDPRGLFTRSITLAEGSPHVLEIEIGASAGTSAYSISAGVQ